MKDCNYRPSGDLQGDTKAMPDKGTRTGMNPGTKNDGMSLDADSTNSLGKITGSTKSDAPGESFPADPTFGEAKGDNDSGTDSEYA